VPPRECGVQAVGRAGGIKRERVRPALYRNIL